MPTTSQVVIESPAVRPGSRRWLLCALLGFVAVVSVLIVVTLVLVDKPHFGWLVGSSFLPIVAATLIPGAVLLFLGVWFGPARNGWRRTALLLWAAVAVSSPVFGIMFLLPFGALALALPVVIPAFVTLWRQTR